MRLGVLRSQPHRLLCFLDRGSEVSFSSQSIRKIQVRQREIRVQLYRRLKLNNGRVGLSLRQQNPAERVVSFRTFWSETYDFLEVRARGGQIALLQRRHALTVNGHGARSGVRICGV